MPAGAKQAHSPDIARLPGEGAKAGPSGTARRRGMCGQAGPTDPGQMRNVAADPEYADAQARHGAALRAELARTKGPCPLPF